MKRTPIITVGQVYLHPEHNEYLVVTKSNRGDIRFSGPGFLGACDVERFLERFGPVDPIDLTEDEHMSLLGLLDVGGKLSTGWVEPDDDDEDGDDE